jgi:hypothetical protein
MNKPYKNAGFYIQIARTHFLVADARGATRKWQDALDEIIGMKSSNTKVRWQGVAKRRMDSQPFLRMCMFTFRMWMWFMPGRWRREPFRSKNPGGRVTKTSVAESRMPAGRLGGLLPEPADLFTFRFLKIACAKIFCY